MTASGDDPTEVRRLRRAAADGTVRTPHAPRPACTTPWRRGRRGGHGVVGHGPRRGRGCRCGTAASRSPPIASYAEAPVVVPSVTFSVVGARALRTGAAPARPAPTRRPAPRAPGPLRRSPRPAGAAGPGAPGTRRQWLADQGFAVVVVDGRGTPGRGPAWEQAVHLDLAGPGARRPGRRPARPGRTRPGASTSTRVAIRGWSFGGYLAALAVLRRPDVFHAAVAGAPGHRLAALRHALHRALPRPPRRRSPPPTPARRCSTDAARLERPLLLVHGLADDNVVAAHTLQLSRALLEAGRPHRVLPLSGVTHMTPQEVVAENLLRLQVAFLRGRAGPGRRAGAG